MLDHVVDDWVHVCVVRPSSVRRELKTMVVKVQWDRWVLRYSDERTGYVTMMLAVNSVGGVIPMNINSFSMSHKRGFT